MTLASQQHERALRIIAQLLDVSKLVQPREVDRKLGGVRIAKMVEIVERQLLLAVTETMVKYVPEADVQSELAAQGLRRIDLDD
jgi:hypothetical protein